MCIDIDKQLGFVYAVGLPMITPLDQLFRVTEMQRPPCKEV